MISIDNVSANRNIAMIQTPSPKPTYWRTHSVGWCAEKKCHVSFLTYLSFSWEMLKFNQHEWIFLAYVQTIRNDDDWHLKSFNHLKKPAQVWFLHFQKFSEAKPFCSVCWSNEITYSGRQSSNTIHLTDESNDVLFNICKWKSMSICLFIYFFYLLYLNNFFF